jgi:aminodeoxyfutalosine synthase
VPGEALDLDEVFERVLVDRDGRRLVLSIGKHGILWKNDRVTGGFQAFIPLAFQPDNTRVPGAKGVGGIDALKTLAISRIYLDNFRHIKAYWVMLGLKIAQVALAFGVNDLDGTVVEEKIGHDAGADSPQALAKDQICKLIRKAGKLPVERDTLYNELKVY